MSIGLDIVALDHGHVGIRKVQEILLGPDVLLRQRGCVQNDGVLRLDLVRQLEAGFIGHDHIVCMPVREDPGLRRAACSDDIRGDVKPQNPKCKYKLMIN